LELQAAQEKLGLTMPGEWHELYSAHNGMNSDGHLGSLFHGMQFLSLDEVARELGNSNQSGEDSLPVRAADPGIKRNDIHNPKWIALAHDGGDTLIRIDMDPDTQGHAGQVIFTDHDDDTAILLAEGLTQFLAQFANDLETGRYFLNKEALADGQQFLDCVAEIDVVNWSRSPKWKHLKR
jgi:cell wall assembly regulator SMI1